MHNFGIAIHGGAGTILRSQMTPEKEQAYRQALKAALDAGYSILDGGGTATDAVEAAVSSLEDCPLFNAGRGSVFNAEGQHEMDASIMEGKTRHAGAIAAIRNLKNPIQLARKVMDHSDHVLLIGEGAAVFAKNHKASFEADEYFRTEHRWDQWEQVKDTDEFSLDHRDEKKYFGTVGAVALDQHGDLAAATSTGGMTNKKFGRVGDSPIIGAGCYADNATCAVSCTGSGEYFMRNVVAYDIACLMKYGNLALHEAAEKSINQHLTEIGGDGGAICIDGQGNISLPFNCDGMYRASKTPSDEFIGIFR